MGLWVVGIAACLGAVILEQSTTRVTSRPPFVATVAAIETRETEEGSYAQVIVELEDGNRASVRGARLGMYPIGTRVLVQEYSSPVLRFRSYRIVRRVGSDEVSAHPKPPPNYGVQLSVGARSVRAWLPLRRLRAA